MGLHLDFQLVFSNSKVLEEIIINCSVLFPGNCDPPLTPPRRGIVVSRLPVSTCRKEGIKPVRLGVGWVLSLIVLTKSILDTYDCDKKSIKYFFYPG